MGLHHTHLNARRWSAVRRAVFERDGWRCVMCGKAGRLECDHVRPLDKGGNPWDPDNLQSLCRSCHVAKTARENRRQLSPREQAWAALVAELVNDNP